MCVYTYICHIFIFSPIDEYLGCFHVLATVNNAAIDIDVQTFFFHFEVKVTQSCPTLCDPTDYIVHGILQPRILECG